MLLSWRAKVSSPSSATLLLPPFHPPGSAAVHGWPEITTAFALGALLYQVAQPYIPDFGTHHHDHEHPDPLEKVGTARAARADAMTSLRRPSPSSSGPPIPRLSACLATR